MATLSAHGRFLLGGLVKIGFLEARCGGILHAARIHAENLAELRIVGRLGHPSFLDSCVFSSLQHMVQVCEQIGTNHSRDQYIAVFSGTAGSTRAASPSVARG